MLVKSQLKGYEEDFGVLSEDGSAIFFVEEGSVRTTSKLLSSLVPVVAMNILWSDKDAWVTCDVAATLEDKQVGLQSYTSLGPKQGLYFPYLEGADVTFHQGSVPFSLDLIFIREDEVVKIEANTEVGSTDRWSCPNCDGVLEVNGGWCSEYEVETGDMLVYFANSCEDIRAFQGQQGAVYTDSNQKQVLAEVAYRLGLDEVLNGN